MQRFVTSLLLALCATLLSTSGGHGFSVGAGVDEETVRALQEALVQAREELEAVEAMARGMASGRLDEDAVLTTPQLISKYGYPAESHDIVTEDGYILTFHRIPHGRNASASASAASARPLYLQHGLMSGSDDWIITGPEHALGYILADAGYDVWIGNARGNKWARRHVSLNPNSTKFWDISWHEMGVYDLPAAIDYILNATGAQALHYVGHSMGTTMFAVMAAEKPEYNAKIRAAALLAPAVFFEHNNNKMYKLLSPYTKELWTVAQLLGVNELFKPHRLYAELGDKFCHDTDPLQVLCVAAAGLVGVNTDQLNKTILPVFLGHFPSGAATKNYIHYGQSIYSGDFRQFDYGTVKNLIEYLSPTPPAYDLSQISAPVAVHYAENDGTVQPEDAITFAERLPNLIGTYIVPKEKFNHLDFVIATEAKDLVYDLLIKQLDQY